MGFIEDVTSFTDLNLSFYEPMKKHTGYGVGGKAKFYAEAKNLYSINCALNLCKQYKIPIKIIGNGTNLLVSDKGYDGLIISTKNLNDLFFKQNQVRAMCGVTIKKLVDFCVEHSLSGAEMLYGIPATIGGAVYMNAGAFMHNISDCIVEVESICDGKLVKRYKDECYFGYRKSIFNHLNEIIVSATFDFTEKDKKEINEKIFSVVRVRRSIHPQGKSLGCVFKNPKKASAGQLIDGAGLKGFTIGGAKVSEVHANFIITNQTASATDVIELIDYVKKKVYSLFNVKLIEEVEIIGDF